MKLTVAQAKKEGFEYYGFSDDGYQAMRGLDEFGDGTITGKERLFNKDPEPAFETTADYIRDAIIENLTDQWDGMTNDDTAEMEEFLKEIPVQSFQEITDILNVAMGNKHYYKLSDIQLIP